LCKWRLPYLHSSFWQKSPRENWPKSGSLRLFKGFLWPFQSCRPLPRIRHFGEAGVGVFPKVENFLVRSTQS
jgi:hypothetical protein